MAKEIINEERNEIEVLGFSVKNSCFGINIEKIQEIVINKKITSIPCAPKGIIGMFQVRDGIYNVIDLEWILFGEKAIIDKDVFYILCNFEGKNYAFVVHNVSSIIKEEKDNISKVPEILTKGGAINITGIIRAENTLISILDVEKIVKNIGHFEEILDEKLLKEIEKTK